RRRSHAPARAPAAAHTGRSDPGPSATPLSEHSGQPLLRSAAEPNLQSSVVLRVRFVRNERELDVPTAGAEELAERLQARLDDVAFPAGDLSTVLAASL